MAITIPVAQGETEADAVKSGLEQVRTLVPDTGYLVYGPEANGSDH